MRLKDYQVAALDQLSGWLKHLGEAEAKAAKTRAAIEALPEDVRASVPLPADPVVTAWADSDTASPDAWRSLKDGMDREIPHVCLKLPTGGGKTRLAAEGADRILVEHFKRRTGFILWIVPSEAIFTQTKKQLNDRSHPIRQALDRASGGRTKILEKLDGFTRQDVEERLCVLMLMLQSSARETKESLKVFRESGRYTSFFPEADDYPALNALRQDVTNLDGFGDMGEAPLAGVGVVQSLGNVLRLIRPLIVLDEGQKAYSKLARETLGGFNPSMILELSATPDRTLSNILVNVPGRTLRDEEMIKLPIRLTTNSKQDWKATLADAVQRLNELDEAARTNFPPDSPRYIRPILIVRVDRTGKEQRGQGFIHAEDAYEELERLGLDGATQIRRQTAEIKELKYDDLLSPYCGVRAIITKDALREGWDCPFAYVLALLSGGTGANALTQMIGRVLRQPHAALTGVEGLDEAHVFCTDLAVGDAVASIKKGLEAEGMGDLGSAVVSEGGDAGATEVRTVERRAAFKGRRIMVPRVMHADGRGGWRELDFEADILFDVDFGAVKWRGAETFAFGDYAQAQAIETRVDLAAGDGQAEATAPFGVDHAEPVVREMGVTTLDRAAMIRRMLDPIPNPWQGARILDDALDALRARGTEAQIVQARFALVETMREDLKAQVDAAAEVVFRNKAADGMIRFSLMGPPHGDFEFEPTYQAHVPSGDGGKPVLQEPSGKPLERSLYDEVYRRDVNGFEKDVALYLDARQAVDWWWRIAARGAWGLQGWRRHKVYPDFLVSLEGDGETTRLLVLETKGKQLAGSDDTQFKQRFFDVLEAAYRSGRDAGSVDLFPDAPDAMRFRILVQDGAWESELQGSLTP